MSAPIAQTAELIPDTVSRPAADPLPALVLMSSPEVRPLRSVRAQRRVARRERRFIAGAAIGVLCLFLVATVLVLDAVR
jgi:hypothetical protein